MTTEKWDVDAVHSSVGFTVRHMVVAKVHGQFTKWSANLALDTDDLTRSQIDVHIDAASIDTRDEKRDAHLKSADFLDVEKSPEISFKGTRVEKARGDAYRVVGDLTIRGVKREVVLDVEFGGRAKDPWGGERVGFTAKSKIDRKEFGLQWNAALETGGVLVGETVDITIEVEAKKAT
ncbi:MAG TPA: YceI family protein [Polyangiaceae bacterium]|nr:YceI family protein [Polyangiaceae bacterium]